MCHRPAKRDAHTNRQAGDQHRPPHQSPRVIPSPQPAPAGPPQAGNYTNTPGQVPAGDFPVNEAVERSESRQLAPFKTAIQQARERFAKVASHTVNYDKEAIFAIQELMKTDYAMKVADQNPQSVRLAMINVASTGLTLNPANGYAYLVPRDGAIHLDISYKGLTKI